MRVREVLTLYTENTSAIVSRAVLVLLPPPFPDVKCSESDTYSSVRFYEKTRSDGQAVVFKTASNGHPARIGMAAKRGRIRCSVVVLTVFEGQGDGFADRFRKRCLHESRAIVGLRRRLGTASVELSASNSTPARPPPSPLDQHHRHTPAAVGPVHVTARMGK